MATSTCLHLVSFHGPRGEKTEMARSRIFTLWLIAEESVLTPELLAGTTGLDECAALPSIA